MQVFKNPMLLNKSRNYKSVLGTNARLEAIHKYQRVQVLADLRVFCNATKSNFSTDPLEMARMEGRREVFNRIANFLNIDYEAYYALAEDNPDGSY